MTAKLKDDVNKILILTDFLLCRRLTYIYIALVIAFHVLYVYRNLALVTFRVVFCTLTILTTSRILAMNVYDDVRF